MSVKPKFGFVVEYVKDIKASKAFYVDVLGLEVERDHPTFVQFENFAIASDVPLAGGGEPEIYWLVPDAEAAYRQISAKAEVSMPLKQMPFGKVFGVRDLDGRPRYLLEFARERPSQRLK